MTERIRLAKMLREADAGVLQARDAAEKKHPVSYNWSYTDQERFLVMADTVTTLVDAAVRQERKRCEEYMDHTSSCQLFDHLYGSQSMCTCGLDAFRQEARS